MRNVLYMIGLFFVIAVAGFGVASVASAEKPPAPPGQDPCSHGRTGKPCKDDPQPDRGKDCEKHGKKGGVNEDHCKGGETTTTTDTTDTTTTETTATTTTETTPTTTTTETQPPETTQPPTETEPPVETIPPTVTPPTAKPPKTSPPPKQPGVEGPTTPKTTPKGKKYCPNGTPVYQGKCFPVAQGSG